MDSSKHTPPTQWELHLRVVVFPSKTHIELRSALNTPAPEAVIVPYPMTRPEVLQLVMAQEVAKRMGA